MLSNPDFSGANPTHAIVIRIPRTCMRRDVKSLFETRVLKCGKGSRPAVAMSQKERKSLG